MSTEEETPQIPVADAPFDDQEGDIILRSSDHVDFYAHSAMLSLASPVFRDMFDLPQPNQSSSPTGYPTKRFVQMTEDRHVLYLFLSWCDTRASISNDISIQDISTVIRVADKFQMDGIASRIGPHLYRFFESEPLSVYAVAFSHFSSTNDGAWGNALARRAAKQLLTKPIPFQPSVDEFAAVPAIVLEPLYTYHRACGQAARQTIQSDSRPALCGIYQWLWLKNCKCPRADFYGSSIPIWWKGFLIRLCELLERQPSTTTILRLELDDELMKILYNQCQCVAQEQTNLKLAEFLRNVKEFQLFMVEAVEKAIEKVTLDFPESKPAT